MAFACRTVERRPASALSRIRVGARRQQTFCHRKTAVARSQVQRCQPTDPARIDRGARVQEQLHDFVMPVLCCDVECRGGFSIACVDLGPRRKQQPDEQVMALPRRNVQDRGGAGAHPPGDQPADCRFVGWALPRVCNARVPSDQTAHCLGVALPRGLKGLFSRGIVGSTSTAATGRA